MRLVRLTTCLVVTAWPIQAGRSGMPVPGDRARAVATSQTPTDPTAAHAKAGGILIPTTWEAELTLIPTEWDAEIIRVQATGSTGGYSSR